MKAHVEEAIFAAAPETAAIELEDAADATASPAGFVPLEQLSLRPVG